MIYWQLFISFFQVGLLSVGGGYAAMPLIQSQVVVQHPWLTLSEFTDLITIAEMTPGPIGINSATFVGIRIGGILGALLASLGFILPGCLIGSLLANLYRRWKDGPVLQGILGALRPAVVALITAAGLSILQLVAVNQTTGGLDVFRLAIAAGAFCLLRWKKPSPIFTMISCGALYLVVGLIAQAMGCPLR